MRSSVRASIVSWAEIAGSESRVESVTIGIRRPLPWNACSQHPPTLKSSQALPTAHRDADAPGARLDDGEFWPNTPEEFFAVAQNPADPHNAFFRQVITYWEMGAAMVLHGAVSAELFVDCNAEGFFLLAKFSHILEAIREKNADFS